MANAILLSEADDIERGYSMTVTAEGTVRGRQVELDADSGLPDGARVRVILEASASTTPNKRERMAALFGICADDPTFTAALAEIERQRGRIPPRQVDIDAAS
jgi:hypothetical protein